MISFSPRKPNVRVPTDKEIKSDKKSQHKYLGERTHTATVTRGDDLTAKVTSGT